MYTINDIEIFIVTYNRAHYLKQSIESLLNQTALVKEITILDNESIDNTEEIAKSFENRGVKYIKTKGFLGNFNKAKEVVAKKYCMLFHDDDLLHPKYLELALIELNRHENIAFITTRYTEFFDNKIPDIGRILSDSSLFENQMDFAKHMYFNEIIAYAPAIYKTEYFLKTDLEYEKYSKFNDWPFMVKIAKFGGVILFEDKAMFYARRHNMQDTWTNTNSLTLKQIVNWDKLFFDIIDIANANYILYEKFLQKMIYFSTGKYQHMLSEEDKLKYTLDDLYQEIINSMNLYKTHYLNFILKMIEENKDLNQKLQLQQNFILETIEENKDLNQKLQLQQNFILETIEENKVLQKIFSIKNKNNYKVIRILGFKITLKRK